MCRTCRRGLSVLEVLLGLAITAILATSLFTAMSASAKNIQANQDLFSATQTARVATQYLAKEVRTKDLCNVGAGLSTAGQPQCALYTTDWSGNDKRAYLYDNAKHQLLLDTAPPTMGTSTPDLDNARSRINSPANSTGNVYVLARQIDDLTFVGTYADRTVPTAVDATTTTDLPTIVNVQIKMKVTVRQNPNEPGRTIELCESVVPRRVFAQTQYGN